VRFVFVGRLRKMVLETALALSTAIAGSAVLFSRPERTWPKRGRCTEREQARRLRWLREAEDLLDKARVDEAHVEALQLLLEQASCHVESRSRQIVGLEGELEAHHRILDMMSSAKLAESPFAALRKAVGGAQVSELLENELCKVEEHFEELESALEPAMQVVCSLENKLEAAVNERDAMHRSLADLREELARERCSWTFKEETLQAQLVALQHIAGNARSTSSRRAHQCEAYVFAPCATRPPLSASARCPSRTGNNWMPARCRATSFHAM